MKTIGTYIYLHNGIEFDYCFKECIESVLPFVDQMVLMDCESTDGTKKELLKYENDPKVKFIEADWDKSVGKDLLAYLSNKGREALDTEFQYLIQADEILDPNDGDYIRYVVNSGKLDAGDTASILRVNYWGDAEHYFGPGYENAPCSNSVPRLGLQRLTVIEWADTAIDAQYVHQTFIKTHHYSFLREPSKFMNKIIDMTEWHGGHADDRVIKMKENGKWDPWFFHPRNKLSKVTWKHPWVIRPWLKQRGFL